MKLYGHHEKHHFSRDFPMLPRNCSNFDCGGFFPLYLEISSRLVEMINHCHKLLERKVAVCSSSCILQYIKFSWVLTYSNPKRILCNNTCVFRGCARLQKPQTEWEVAEEICLKLVFWFFFFFFLVSGLKKSVN